jgi:hypothetical protein
LKTKSIHKTKELLNIYTANEEENEEPEENE